MATASKPGQAYNPNMGGEIAPGSVAVTEDKTRTGGSVGGCGEASLLAVVAPQLKGVSTSPSALGALIQWADNHGLTLAANGDSTPSNLIGIARQYFGITLNSFGSLPTQYVGKRQIEVGISRAYNLGGWNSNVDGHYITIVGKTEDGNYIVSDPNQPESENGQFIVYTPSQIQNAAPFWYGAATKAPTGLGGVTAAGQALTTTSSGAGASSFDWATFLQGIASNIPIVGGIFSGNASTNPLNALEAVLGNLGGWVGNPIRLIKLAVGLALVGAAVLSVVLPAAAAPTAAVATAASGAPEAAPAVYSAVKSVTNRNKQPQAPTPPASQTIPYAATTVQRSYTTRNLQAQQRAAYQAQIAPSVPTPVRAQPTTSPQGPGNRPSLAPTIGPQNPPRPKVTRPLAPSPFPAMPPGPRLGAQPTARTPAMSTPSNIPVQRGPKTGLTQQVTPRRAPITQPLKGPKVVGTDMPMTSEEAADAWESLVRSWRTLPTGRTATGTPQRSRTWGNIDNVLKGIGLGTEPEKEPE